MFEITRPDRQGLARGSVLYNWEWPEPDLPSKVVVDSRPWAPRWMVDFFGIDHFGHVVCVRLATGLRETDELMDDIGRLTRLEELSLWRTDVDDAGLIHLAGLTGLKTLVLNHTHVTDAGLVHLRSLGNLQSLDLGDTEVGDAGLENLTRLRKLRELIMLDTRVTAEGAKKLVQALPALAGYYSPRNEAPAESDSDLSPRLLPGDFELRPQK